MTKTTLVTTLKALGRLIYTYRHAWPGTPGDRNPIRRLAIPELHAHILLFPYASLFPFLSDPPRFLDDGAQKGLWKLGFYAP